ncbi:MAG: polysaccharide deacetylase family protein [Lachnospiraceae bacterium]|nr:polysaccharide deacetylase family protein [Lachnospiraceae bacterium]
MWNGKRKAVTFSYDDGVEMDRRLVEIFNRYGMKATFNLNSGIQTSANSFQNKDVLIRRMNVEGLPALYAGHEIAVHCLTHANLPKFDDATIYNEILQDKANLERIFGQEIKGMAYPYGTFDERVMRIVADCGIHYARTVIETGDFSISENLLALKASAHHNRPDLLEMIDRFVEMEPETPQLLYIWGHSYEFEVNRNWDRIEEICRRLAGREDIFYGTNSEVLLG